MEKEKPKVHDPKLKNRKQSLKHRGHRRLPYNMIPYGFPRVHFFHLKNGVIFQKRFIGYVHAIPHVLMYSNFVNASFCELSGSRDLLHLHTCHMPITYTQMIKGHYHWHLSHLHDYNCTIIRHDQSFYYPSVDHILHWQIVKPNLSLVTMPNVSFYPVTMGNKHVCM